jgi:hypothetical protein
MAGKTKTVEVELTPEGQPKDPGGLINLLLNATEIKGATAGQYNEEILNDSIDSPPE